MLFPSSKLLVSCALLATASFSALGYKWTVPNASDWRVEADHGAPVLHLVVSRGPLPGPRRPIQFALAGTPEFQRVSIDVDVRPLERSLILVFAYRDSAHFDYAHLSIDRGSAQPNHNGIFHVYGGERARISSEGGPAAFTASKRWYSVRLTHDGQSGRVQVTVDGQLIPALQAVDLSLRTGKVGLGSFDETGDFKNLRIDGTPATSAN